MSRLLRDEPVIDITVANAGNINGRHSTSAFVQLSSSSTAAKIVDSIVRSQEGSSLIVEICDEDELSRAKRSHSRDGNGAEVFKMCTQKILQKNLTYS